MARIAPSKMKQVTAQYQFISYLYDRESNLFVLLGSNLCDHAAMFKPRRLTTDILLYYSRQVKYYAAWLVVPGCDLRFTASHRRTKMITQQIANHSLATAVFSGTSPLADGDQSFSLIRALGQVPSLHMHIKIMVSDPKSFFLFFFPKLLLVHFSFSFVHQPRALQV